MFDFNWSHLLIFAVAAIVLVPSKDLPALLRNIGKYIGQARRMAQEFRGQLDDALRESELAELQKSVQSDMHEIEKSASMADTERALKDAVTAPVSPAPAQSPTLPNSPSGQIIPSVSTSLPVEEASTAALRAPTAAVAAEPAKVTAMPEPAEALAQPAPPAMNGSRARSDGIEVVRAGRGSVAQRAAAAWKKTANPQAGSEG